MTTKLPQVSKLTLPGEKQADLADVVTEIAIDYVTDSVSELSIVFADTNHKIAKRASKLIGQSITFDGVRWQVGSVDSELAAWGSLITLRARDPLAKKLRVTYKTSAEKKVSPGQWVTGRVKRAGGRAIVQPSSKRGTIAQSKNQSVIDVISDLASDLEWSWVSHSGVFIFGSRFAAWQGKLGGLPTWQVSWDSNPSTDALAASWSDSDDNTENRADLEIELAYEHGVRLRPWHRLASTIPGADGTWLIESVNIIHDGVTPVQITATKPKKPSPKAGSSAEE